MYRAPMELRDLVQVYNDRNRNSGNGFGNLQVECDYGFKLIIIGDGSTLQRLHLAEALLEVVDKFNWRRALPRGAHKMAAFHARG